MHTPCNAVLVSQENLHVIQQENANDLQLSWNPSLLLFIKGRLQSKQSTLGFLVKLNISEQNTTTCIPVCAKCPPVAQELIIPPIYPSGYSTGIFQAALCQ